MGAATQTIASGRLALEADTAADLMTPNPVSVRHDAGLLEAVDLMGEMDVSAVPVLDDVGHPVGVLSRTNLVRLIRETARPHPPAAPGGAVPPSAEAVGRGTHARPAAVPAVREVMSPALLSVAPATPAIEVVARLLGLGNVHRVFVVDDAGDVVGAVSARDVLRRLRRAEAR